MQWCITHDPRSHVLQLHTAGDLGAFLGRVLRLSSSVTSASAPSSPFPFMLIPFSNLYLPSPLESHNCSLALPGVQGTSWLWV